MQTPDFTPMVIPVIWLNSHPGSKRRMDCNYELGHTAPYADSLYLFIFPHSGNTVTFKFQHVFSWGSSSTFSRNHVGLNVLWKHAWRDINLGWLDQEMLPREGEHIIPWTMVGIQNIIGGKRRIHVGIRVGGLL